MRGSGFVLDNRRPAASVSQVRLIQLPVIIALFPGTNPSIQTIQHALKGQQSKLIQVHRNGSCTSNFFNYNFVDVDKCELLDTARFHCWSLVPHRRIATHPSR